MSYKFFVGDILLTASWHLVTTPAVSNALNTHRHDQINTNMKKS